MSYTVPLYSTKCCLNPVYCLSEPAVLAIPTAIASRGTITFSIEMPTSNGAPADPQSNQSQCGSSPCTAEQAGHRGVPPRPSSY